MSVKSLRFMLLLILSITGLANKAIPATLPNHTEQEEKLRRVEKAADKFIQRWHETLNLNVLFDELYITNAKQRRRNVYLYCGVFAFLTGTTSPDCFKIRRHLGEETMQEGFFAFWNMAYLQDEYHLLFSDDDKVSDPPELEELRKMDEEAEKRLEELMERDIRSFAKEQIELHNKVSSVYKQRLSLEGFQSPVYRENLQRRSEPAKVVKGFSDWGVKDGIVYKAVRNTFEIYFVEENGEFKILTLGFEL